MGMDTKELNRIRDKKKEWEERCVKPSLKKFGIEKSPARFYTPEDIKEFNFEDKVGFPGAYPFTAGNYAVPTPGLAPSIGSGFQDTGKGLVRAGQYSGYGTAEDTRDYYKQMISMGQVGGPNLAFQLPTQCGYDSDHPKAQGEVGKTGVAIDSLMDMETIYEPYTGDKGLDKIASNWTINGPASMILAMYIAIAQKQEIPLAKLKGTLQNDILKEYVGRGTQIFPPGPSMRLTRDIMVYCTEFLPSLNFISCCSAHIRSAGCTREQAVGILLANAAAYIQMGVDAGLDVDTFMRRFTFLGIGGSIEMLKEVAANRALRRMFAKMIKERFGAKSSRTMMMKTNLLARTLEADYTIQRPLNNLTRSVIGGIAAALVGGTPSSGMGFPWDEPLGLGHSNEAWQLHRDAARIIQFESGIGEALDPLAGSYYVESLTDDIEKGAWDVYNKIESLGGSLKAIETGWMQREVARAAYKQQKDVETCEKIMVGANSFKEEDETEVMTERLVAHPYDPRKREEAELTQIAKLKKLRRDRDNDSVKKVLQRMQEAAKDEDANLMPHILEAVKAYATIGEMCDALRSVFGEYRGFGVI
jgi:methylmalonyl-CoA mutase N-terminal domain/subunit